MPTSTALQVVLSADALRFVQSKVASGQYASESDVINRSLETLKELGEEREHWEQNALIPAYDAVIADPSSTIPIETVRQNLQARRRQRLTAK